MRKMIDHLAELSRQKIKATAALTSLIEATTMLFRFGFGLQSTTHTASTIGRLTMGIRIHHGYIGFALLLVVLAFFKRHRYAELGLVIGFSLIISDAIHHTLLYLITGSADLDLVYPGYYQ